MHSGVKKWDASQEQESVGKNILYFALVAALAVLVLAFVRRSGLQDEEQIVREWTYRIDLNEGTREELTLLPGIGPHLAEEIVKYRQASGPFQSLSDLERVKGVGPSKIARLAPCVMIRRKEISDSTGTQGYTKE
jgi:competence ComEA-like helix-hairpin-helix protein